MILFKAKKQKPSVVEEVLPTVYHTSCETLPLNEFIEAFCNDNYSGLVISGKSDPTEIQNAWNEILADYGSLIKSETSEYIFSLSKEIALLKWHITYVNGAVVFLENNYDEEIAQQVRDLGYEVPQFTDENYQKALSRITSLVKTKIFEHSNLIDEFDRISNVRSGQKQTKEDFVSLLIILSKHQGYNIDRKTTTVYDFTQIFNNYLTEINIRQKQLKS
ncbi:MAG: hypothetical protein ACTHM7_14155 [Ginsengibacter sp.]